MRKRILSTLLALCMVLSLLPGTASAAGGTSTMNLGETIQLTSDEGKNSYPAIGGVERIYVWTLENVAGYKASEVVSITYDNSQHCQVSALGQGQARVSCKVTMIYDYMDMGTGRPKPGYETAVGGIWTVTVNGDACTVTFDLMDGTAPVKQEAFVGGTIAEPKGVTRDGFELDGWFTDVGLTQRYNFSAKLTGDLTLYAKWLPLRTVTFQSMGETAAERIVADGRTVNPPALDGPRGYAIAGWYTDPVYASVYDFTSPVTSDLTLYAKWRLLDEVSVSFDCLDGLASVSMTVYEGETVNRPVDPGREGYVFDGWYTDKNCTADSLYGFDEPLNNSMVLYAGWRRAPETVRVLFDSQGGSYIMSQTVMTGEQAVKPESPERDGYTFSDWYTGPDCTEKWDFRNSVTGAMTLYAGWTRKEYTVTFICQPPDGKKSVKTQTVKRDGTAVEPDLPQSRYLFGGWIYDAGALGKTAYDLSRPVTGDLLLEALWLEPDQGSGSMTGSTDAVWNLADDGVLTVTGKGGSGRLVMSKKASVSTIKVENGVDSLDYNAFSSCENALSVSLSEGLKSIGMSAFYGCTNLTGINLPSSVDSIDTSAFQRCSSLQAIEIPERVRKIPFNAFNDCVSLRSVTLPEGLESIDTSAFKGSGTLWGMEITLPESLTSIGYEALAESGLRSVRVPGRVREVGENAFYNCALLETAELADGVETICKSAFYGCTALHTVIIPTSVTKIEMSAFANIGSGTAGPVHIFYAGSREQWAAIDIDSTNSGLKNAVIHYNCYGAGTLVPVYFNSQGGGPVEELLCLSGEFLEKSQTQTPGREGYSFTGWYKDPACTEPWNFDGDRVSRGITLYAGWDPYRFSVYCTGIGSQTVYCGQRAEKPAAPVRKGAKFNGWYIDEAATMPYLFRTPVTGHLTLYPGWLEEREIPSYTGPYSLAGWEGNTVTLSGPAQSLGDIRQIWAACYNRDGKMTDLAAGQLAGVTITFSKPLAEGWRLFLLDANTTPVCKMLVL